MERFFLEGPGAIQRWQEFSTAAGIRKPLVVGSKRFFHYFENADAVFFSGYHPNPELKDAQVGAELFRQEGCDGLISIGGGSAMDTAKTIKYHLRIQTLPHLAVPTTAGTGSEATRFAVVYVDGKKQSLDESWLLPDGAILDASLLASLPEYHRRACLVDALAQCIESYWAKAATDESRALAAEGIRAVQAHLEGYLQGNLAAAQGMLHAAWLSGRAIEITRTTAPHAMSYALTTGYSIAHGHSVGLTLPHVWRMMAPVPAMQPILAQLDALMGGDGAQWFEDLMQRLELHPPQGRSEDLDGLAASVNVQRLNNHPFTLTHEALLQLYAQALRLV